MVVAEVDSVEFIEILFVGDLLLLLQCLYTLSGDDIIKLVPRPLTLRIYLFGDYYVFKTLPQVDSPGSIKPLSSYLIVL